MSEPILEVVRHELGHWLVRFEGEDVGVVDNPGIITTEAPYAPYDFSRTEFRFSVILW